MRRIVPLIGVSAAVVLFAAGFVAGSRFDAAPAAANESFVVIEHTSPDVFLDLGEEGASVGDTLVFSNDLYNVKNANMVGTEQGLCVHTVVGKLWECAWTNIFENGTIVTQGPGSFDVGQFTVAITGGTGDYSDAGGELTIKKLDEKGTEYESAFELN